MERIITKSTNRVRTEFTGVMGGIGWIETILIALWVIFLATIISLTKFYISIPIGFLAFIFVLVLLTPNPKGSGKVYNYFFHAFSFLINKKKYTREEVLQFFPFDVKKSKNLKLTNGLTMTVMEIDGFDISLLSENECNQYVTNLSKWFKNIDCKTQLIKVEKNFDLQQQNQYLIELSEYWEKQYNDNKISKKVYQNIADQLEDKQSIYFNIEDNQNFKKNCFYLVAYSHDEQEANHIIRYFNYHLTKAKLTIKILNNDEIVQLLDNLFFPLEENNKNNDIKEWLNKIKTSNIKFHKNYFSLNNNFYSIVAIKDYPNFVEDGWLIKLANLENTNLICNFIDLDKSEAIKMLNKAILRVQMRKLDAKKPGDEHDNELYESNYNYLMAALKENNEKLKLTQIYFLTYANSLEKLKEINGLLFSTIRESDMLYNNLSFQQKTSFNFIFNNIPLKDTLLNSNEMSCLTIAGMFPFIDNTLMDRKGLLMGQTNIGAPYFLDTQLNDNKKRTSFSTFVVGKTGYGKSFNVKKTLNWHFLNKNKIFIIDPEREYHGYAIQYEAKIIDCGQARTGLINPLQVLDEETDLPKHIRNLEQWFKLIFPDMKDYAISILEELLINVYKTKNINLTDKGNELIKLKVTDWPILNDLYLLAENKYKNSKNENAKEITAYLKQLSYQGALGTLWNGYTTLNIANDKFIIFDIYTLRNDKRTRNAQLFLMLNFLINQAIQNKNVNELLPDELKQFMAIAVDEAHLLIDQDNPLALQFLYEMVKRARKYQCSMLIATQNINDFVGNSEIKKQSEGILNNILYKFVHHLDEKDISDYNSILQSTGGLNEYEIHAIATAEQGECLFSMKSGQRVWLKIETTETEANVWMTNKNIISNLNLDQLTINQNLETKIQI